MIQFSKYTTEYRALTKLGLPITISQIGMTLQGLADTIMLGQHSATDLAAAGFVNSIFIIAILLGIGFDGGCPGIWYGFPFGLTTAAILYLRCFRMTMGRYSYAL